MRSEQAEVALQSARKTSRDRLLDGLKALQKADDRLKSGADERAVLEFLVAGLAGRSV
jgi:DNA polymerase III delta subunit